ncbi:rhamnan synthesis F family protein [Paracoccus jeotgali]|uniref:Glycosyl transferase n=1 Tax=Paracoccus jeotgali TaxID=2065379 RepID=A0A2K9MHI1_9RHOB|nr:rhamnan synthesis F family protein [Paracoccus jeotgali]AUM75099.1 glycosyl transferase [Paracoccus jeotgali]
MRFNISICAKRSNAKGWGDLQYAEGLQRALEARGIPSHLFFRGETPQLSSDDVVLRIAGPLLEEPIVGVPNLLWIISPPNVMTAALLGRYQHLYIASQFMAQRLAGLPGGAHYLQQSTEHGHFHPDRRPDGAPELPVVFVGAYAPRAPRKSVLMAIEAGIDVHVWGPGWKGVIPDRLWRGAHLDYDELAQVYASARIVLNDHMPNMALTGMMSNRSFDAIASGAVVISDPVQGFDDPDLPELIQQAPGPELTALIRHILSQPGADREARLDRHRRIVSRYSFAAVAARLAEDAGTLLAAGRVARAHFHPRSDGTAPPLLLADVTQSAGDQRQAMLGAAREIVRIFAALEYPRRGGVALSPPAAPEGVIHPLMHAQRRAQDLALSDPQQLTCDDLQILAQARRVLDASDAAMMKDRRRGDALQVHHMRGEPLWAHAPDGYAREENKRHLALWPRRNQPRLDRPVGVFLHLFYDDLAPVFASRINRIAADFQLYISTDTPAKADHIRTVFPQADIRVLPNRGRDICPKLYGFRDAYDRHDLVLHLHGKKSPHSARLDQWLEHCLDCLLPEDAQINRILSLFQSVPDIGLLAPVVFKSVLSAAHWAANTEIGRELAFRVEMPQAEIDKHPRFPVGSMFWGRTETLRPLLDLGLRPDHFPPEQGQVDGTLAHAIERMIGVVCNWTGRRTLLVAPSSRNLYAGFQCRYRSNREVLDALTAGAL